MNFILDKLAKAKNNRQLKKILNQVEREYGFLSKEYNVVVNYCWERI